MSEVLERTSGVRVRALDRSALDVTRPDDVRAAVREARPDWVINCSAYNDVERAEVEPEQAFLVNDSAVGYLADAAEEFGARLVHVSTDYVFSGDFGGAAPRPYREDDSPAPLNAYGASKLAGERRLKAHGCRSIILRTSWLYGGRGGNFVTTMLDLGERARRTGEAVRVVRDQVGVPTDAWSLAAQIERLIREDVEGLFHAAAVGGVSRLDLVKSIYRLAKIEVALEPVRLEDFASRARRPHYSVLENRRLDALGLSLMLPWQEGLEKVWPHLRSAE